MTDERLKLAIADYDRVRALADERVSLEEAGLDIEFLAPSETFYRMLKFEEFDISEMSLSSFLIAKSQGKNWSAIPVFPFRSFFHTNLYCNVGAGIEHPKDLEGKRVGLTEYQVTAAVWMRGTLQHEFGVDLTKIDWFVERTPEMSHGGVTDFHPPKGITIEQISSEETLQSLAEAGELDAILPSPYPGLASRLNRTDENAFHRSSKLRRLFEDPIEEGRRYFRRTGIIHMNHTVVLKDSTIKAYPEIAMSLYEAFVESKSLAYARLEDLRRSSLVFASSYIDEERELFGGDPYPYGTEANRGVLETLIGYSYEQGLISSRPSVEELFEASTLPT